MFLYGFLLERLSSEPPSNKSNSFTKKGDDQARVCGKSQLYRGQGPDAAEAFLPVSGMFSKIVSDSLCCSCAGLYRVSLGHLVPKENKTREG